MNLCKDCKHWNNVWAHGVEPAGRCSHPKIQEEPREVLVDGAGYYPMYDIGAVFETGPEFGCIHWEPKS